jgi:multidrug resistance efflux pump
METEFIKSEESLHTEQVQDIIGTPPRWLYQWGITLVLAVVLLCLFISSVINYPEAVKTQIEMLSASSADGISFKDSARLIKILAPNDTTVKKGESLAIIENAIGKITIKAPKSGKLTYAGIVHEGELLAPGQNIFFISLGYSDFYGEMIIPQNEAYKVKPGQTVFVKLRNSPDEKRSLLKGIIRYISSDQPKNEQYLAEVDFDNLNNKTEYLLLRNGTVADAEVITANATLFHRLIKSLTKGIK